MTTAAGAFSDWVRLQRALALEAEDGFQDLMGRQCRFSEFLQQSLAQLSPAVTTPAAQQRHQTLSAGFQDYRQLSPGQRQHLVAETRRFIHQLQKAQVQNRQASPSPKSRTPQTQPLVEPTASRTAIAGVRYRANSRNNPLDRPLRELPGIGSRSADRLTRLNLLTVRDLLFYYPRDHIDYARQVKIRDLVAGETVTLVGAVRRCTCFGSPRNPKLTILEVVIKDGSGQLKLSRFFAGNRYRNRGWQEQQKRLYPPGAVVAASGLVKESKFGITLENPDLEVLEHSGSSIESLKVGRVVPVYPLTEGIQPDLVRRAVVAALPAAVHLPEPLPETLRQRYDLVEIPVAIAHIHFPPDSRALDIARRRLVFDEFFYLQLGLLQRRQQQRQVQTGAILVPQGQRIEQFYQILPFELTHAQQRVINEIRGDIQSSSPMNRLIQGDVGSGKTVVAVVAMLAAIQSGYQTALMAPTEVLAEQHFRKLVGWFNQLYLPVELLTGSTTAVKRRQIHAQLQTGELPVLVGTHALIQEAVQFRNLGLVVIDEQHRFGVEQRARLQQKGEQPHVLTMTATPIPRTLALTLHGDLEVSQIDELPPGRQTIQTTLLTGGNRTQAYDLIRREVAQGRQAYVVLPLVEESEKLDLRSAIEEHQRLQETIFPNFQVGLLHGRMSSAEKDTAIGEFRRGETQILVSTTVVEVGVDIPNATVILIEHAERFGLSQLHQLRGRVGRGTAQSFCLLVNSSKAETARQRLGVLAQSQDGFLIAEMDMRFRGPGAVLGTRQSGLPDFALASLVEDQEVLELAREAATKVIEKDPTLDRWPLMQAELTYRYQRLLGGAILT